MTSEIPEDIMDVAFHLTAGDWNQPHDVRAKKVAQALLAERERCAKIAEDKHWSVGGLMQVDTTPIAAAIRQQATP